MKTGLYTIINMQKLKKYVIKVSASKIYLLNKNISIQRKTMLLSISKYSQLKTKFLDCYLILVHWIVVGVILILLTLMSLESGI